MDKDIKGGLALDQPRLLLKEDGVLGRALFYWALLLLGGLGGWGSFITAFGVPVYAPWLVAAGMAFAAFCVWRQTDSRRRWWPVSLLGWAAWLLMVVFRFDGAAHGAVRVVNLMLDCYGTKLNYELPSLRLPYSVGGSHVHIDTTGECTGFIIVLLFPFFWAMARMWVRGRNSRGPFALTGILLLLPMSFSIIPAGWAFGALLMFWCMLLLLATSLSGAEGVKGSLGGRRYKVSGVAVARPEALLMLLGVGLCMWIVYLIAPLETYERPLLAESLRTAVREGVGSSQYFRGGQGNSNKEVKLRSMGARTYTGETVLRVKFDWLEDGPEVGAFIREGPYGETMTVTQRDGSGIPAANAHKEYLRSFVGTEYTGQSWERLDYAGREELSGIELVAQNQMARNKREMFSNGRDKWGWYHLSVQNLGANPRCIYIPASLRSSQEELADYGIELVDDSYARSQSFVNGTREYELDADGRAYGFNYFSRVLSYIGFKDYWVENFHDMGSANTGDLERDPYAVENLPSVYWTIIDNEYRLVGGVAFRDLLDSINTQGDAGGPGWAADLWVMPENECWEGLGIEQQELLRATEDYNRFVYDHYLDVPEELRGFLADFAQAYDLDPMGNNRSGDFRFKDGVEFYAQRIARCFREYFNYNLDPPQPPGDTDFVEFFLGESHKGYCVHFATAAVMLLRAAGYPARYAEGYVVPSGGGGWVDVPDYNAHAWVEVYCGGTGWVPVEVTPAALDNPAAFYNATVPEDPVDYIPTPRPETERPTMPPRRNPLIDEELSSPTPAPASTAAPTEAPGGPGKGGGGGADLRPALFGLGGVAALVGLVLLQRALRVRKRRRDLSQRDRNAAGLRAYGYLMRLYEKEILCGERGDPPPRWKELAEKARFSAHELSGGELSELLEDAERLKEKLRRQLPRGQKLLCWLSGLI